MKHGISLPSGIRLRMARALRTPLAKKAVLCLLRAALGFVISQGVTFGEYSPFGLGYVAVMAGSGTVGLFGSLGVMLGYARVWSMLGNIKYAAGALLIYTTVAAFTGTKLAAKRYFAPSTAAIATAAVGFVFVLGRGFSGANVALFMCEVTLVFGFCYFAGFVFDSKARPDSDNLRAFSVLMLIAATALGLSGFNVLAGMSLGRIAAVLVVLCAASAGGVSAGAAAGVTLGVVFDIGGGGGFYSMSYGFAGLLAGAVSQGGRFASAAAYVLAGGALVLVEGAGGPRFSALYETFAASVVFILLPANIRFMSEFGRLTSGGGARVGKQGVGVSSARLTAVAAAYSALGDAVYSETPQVATVAAEGTAIRRAARRACGECRLRPTCWDGDTLEGLAAAARVLRDRASIEVADLPAAFAERCVKPEDFARFVSEEYRVGQIERRQVARADVGAALAAAQYRQVATVLGGVVAAPQQSAATPKQVFTADISAASRRRKDSDESGDRGTWFKTPGGEVAILLSDGMGSGADAGAASEEMLRLVEGFMAAAVPPIDAVEAVSGGLATRGGEVFATLDLMVLDLHKGDGEIIKCGAAPTYIRGGGAVCRVGGRGLPPGVEGMTPFRRRFNLTACDVIVMVTDGVSDGIGDDDKWLRQLINDFDGGDAKALALAIVAAAVEQSGCADDLSVVTVKIG